MLDTSEKVIQRAGLAALPQYEDVSPMSDSPGFYTFRPYPGDTELSRILTTRRPTGRPLRLPPSSCLRRKPYFQSRAQGLVC